MGSDLFISFDASPSGTCDLFQLQWQTTFIFYYSLRWQEKLKVFIVEPKTIGIFQHKTILLVVINYFKVFLIETFFFHFLFALLCLLNFYFCLAI